MYLFIYIYNLCKLSSWTIMERATRRVNSAYYDEVYDAFWAQKNFVQEDIKKTMDARPGDSSSKIQKKQILEISLKMTIQLKISVET